MSKTAAERQQEYQKRLKKTGRKQFRVTLGKEASERLEYFEQIMPEESKCSILEWCLEVAYKMATPAVPEEFKGK
jgi:hypothetical protein